MRCALSVLALGCAIVTQAAGQTTPKLGQLGAAILGVVKAGASTLVIMPTEEGSGRVWAAWTDDAAEPRLVRLALIDGHAGVAIPVWAVQNDGGYAPRLSTPSGWTFDGRPVLLLQYELGAAFTHADLYGVDGHGTPKPLGAVEGALIDSVELGGVDILRVYDSADLKGPPGCHGWSAKLNTLVTVACEGGDARHESR